MRRPVTDVSVRVSIIVARMLVIPLQNSTSITAANTTPFSATSLCAAESTANEANAHTGSGRVRRRILR